jgi:hypothetical protein
VVNPIAIYATPQAPSESISNPVNTFITSQALQQHLTKCYLTTDLNASHCYVHQVQTWTVDPVSLQILYNSLLSHCDLTTKPMKETCDHYKGWYTECYVTTNRIQTSVMSLQIVYRQVWSHYKSQVKWCPALKSFTSLWTQICSVHYIFYYHTTVWLQPLVVSLQVRFWLQSDFNACYLSCSPLFFTTVWLQHLWSQL